MVEKIASIISIILAIGGWMYVNKMIEKRSS